jgi:transcriptional regulator with XRE-family HTH domain
VANKRLDNYLRVYRKKAGFTQREASFLLGSLDPRYFGRFERGERQPALEVTYFCERIFGISNTHLFPGLRSRSYKKAERLMAMLDCRLRARIPQRENLSRRISHKLEWLAEQLQPLLGALSL